MKVLIVGGGGREHALAWKAAQSPSVTEVLVAPGNAGTQRERKVRNVPVSADDIPALVKIAAESGVGLTIVGPEAPLVSGIVDAFSAASLRCFGPSRAAAQLEGSKSFTKDFLARHGIPTAEYNTFTEVEPACQYIERQGAPVVIKADGLAAGKGVTVADSPAVAVQAVRDCLAAHKFGEAGKRVVIEEYLAGEEASFICVVDRETALPLASSQDHKARDDGDGGPNTGGMGAYSPAPIVTDALHQRIMREVIEPTVAGLVADGHPYVGFLYAGLMIDERGSPKVLEYNCRFGDPETQPIIMRLNTDLVAVCNAALDGALHSQTVEWDNRAALGVVMAAGGYPGAYRKGDVIEGLDGLDSAVGKVFHAGTTQRDGAIVTDGGRVLCVTALGETVSEAQRSAYDMVAQIHWPDAYWRTDIGYRAVAREQSKHKIN
ncbi:MAG: phosphoribosylamine--glycine ligase [Gammaproteobacteria bacterium]|nr:phosphoribosylamine--glycine ligase [Gammaproteobacteria bacterium]